MFEFANCECHYQRITPTSPSLMNPGLKTLDLKRDTKHRHILTIISGEVVTGAPQNSSETTMILLYSPLYIYIVCNYKYSSIYNYHGIIIFTIRNHYIYICSYKYVYIYIYIPHTLPLLGISNTQNIVTILGIIYPDGYPRVNHHPDDLWWVYSIV